MYPHHHPDVFLLSGEGCGYMYFRTHGDQAAAVCKEVLADMWVYLGDVIVACDHALSLYLCNLFSGGGRYFFPSRAKEAKKQKKNYA